MILLNSWNIWAQISLSSILSAPRRQTECMIRMSPQTSTKLWNSWPTVGESGDLVLGWGTIDCVFILLKIFSPCRSHNLADKLSVDHEQECFYQNFEIYCLKIRSSGVQWNFIDHILVNLSKFILKILLYSWKSKKQHEYMVKMSTGACTKIVIGWCKTWSPGEIYKK